MTSAGLAISIAVVLRCLCADGSAVVDAEFDGQHAAGNFALRGILVNARYHSSQRESIHGVGHGTGIELI
jgi:hypothetical protein